ncbi:MAG: glycosyltransferase family 39 protein, partial [Phycisphaerae bacterium]
MLAAIGIAIAALVAHGRALPHPFHLDDPILIVGDPRVTTCDVAAIFSQEYWPGEAGGNRVWRPLTTLSLALQWQITHAAWAFRSVNSMIHVLAALALFLLARRVLGAAMPAFAAAALFVVHPLHTTPLNQIIDRADLLATALTLLSCVLAIGAAETRQAWRSAVLMLLIAAALLCKESAIAVVGMLIALHVFTARRGSGEDEAAGRSRGLLRDWTARVYLPACVAIGGVLLVRLLVLGGVGRSTDAINPLDNILANPALVLAPGESAYLARWGTPLAVLAVALGKFAWPSPLSWDYSYAAIDVVRSWRDPRFLAGVLLVIGAIASAAISLRRTRRTFAAIALTASAYAVVANVAIVIGALFAER